MDELISRQAAIDALEFGITYAKVFNKETGEVRELFSEANEELRKAVERIKQLPSAQKEFNTALYADGFADGYKQGKKDTQQWIPVEERLPKVGRTVICQCRADILKLLKLDSGGDWYQDAEHAYMNGFVIAWMPLPEPYKEEEE